MKEYSFQMTKEEVRELSLRAIWEQQRLRHFKWLWFPAVILALEFVFRLWAMIMMIVILLLMIFALTIMVNYFAMKKQLCGKTRTMQIEAGVLKAGMEGKLYSEIPCSSVTEVRRTRRLLMLGVLQAPKLIAWYPVPLRVFADGQERDSFLESVRNPQVQAEGETAAAGMGEAGEPPVTDFEASAAEKSEREFFCFSFQIGEEEWVRMMTAATEIIQAGILGEQKNRFVRIVPAAAFSLLSCVAAWLFPDAAGVFRFLFILGVIFSLALLRGLLENPEKTIRAQIRKGMMQDNVLGTWEISVTEAGIRQSISEKNNVIMPWESLLCAVETDNELFFYQKDKRHFCALLKGEPENREQMEGLKELCREKQVEVLTGKRKKYLPGWLFKLLIFVVLAGYCLLTYRAVREDGDFDHVPFDRQVSVLRSLGFSISEEMEEDLYAYMEEYEVASYVEQYPYTWLLNNLVWADEERADRSQDSVEVFWFDFEGWDICTDYIRILEEMQNLAAGSILDDVANLREDTEDIDWEKGAGTITVSLEWKGQEHSWKMDVESDWIDAEVLGIYNGLLEKEGISERFYVTGDDGQGVFVFYCTEEWAAEFEYATGLDIETYRVEKGW